jgi:hypothetical protein
MDIGYKEQEYPISFNKPISKSRYMTLDGLLRCMKHSMKNKKKFGEV